VSGIISGGSAGVSPALSLSLNCGRDARAPRVNWHYAAGRSMDKINLAQKFSLFKEHWSPKIVAELNGQYVKLVKFSGEFVWHHHDHEDELFLVVKGKLVMHFKERDVAVEEGEFIVVPRGVEHKPEAVGEAHVVLFEPKSTLNTGNVRNERTLEELERV